MRTLLELIFPGRLGRRIDRLADEVAERSRFLVRRRLTADLGRMSHHESRGYIRARASGIVRRDVDLVLGEDENLPGMVREALLARSLDRVVALILADLRARTAQPLRRAA